MRYPALRSGSDADDCSGRDADDGSANSGGSGDDGSDGGNDDGSSGGDGGRVNSGGNGDDDDGSDGGSGSDADDGSTNSGGSGDDDDDGSDGGSGSDADDGSANSGGSGDDDDDGSDGGSGSDADDGSANSGGNGDEDDGSDGGSGSDADDGSANSGGSGGDDDGSDGGSGDDSVSPTYPKHRRILKGHFLPEDYKLPDHHLAALIIRKSTFLPDTITPLLQKDTHTNNEDRSNPLYGLVSEYILKPKMGNGTSGQGRIVCIKIGTKLQKITFSYTLLLTLSYGLQITFTRQCARRDILDILANAAGVSRRCKLQLTDEDGHLIDILPTMAVNTERTPYLLTIIEKTKTEKEDERDSESEMMKQVVNEVVQTFDRCWAVSVTTMVVVLESCGFVRTEQWRQCLQNIEAYRLPSFSLNDNTNESISRCTNFQECKNKLEKRVRTLENVLLAEANKLLEVEACKKEIGELKVQLQLLPIVSLGSNNLGADMIIQTRTVPEYSKYTLSQETINYLKQPTFDIWYWEPNEMLSLLEYMYHELGLVEEFTMNTVVLKRWLINARTELAVRYNDISPLENHHCAVAFQILSNPETNIFGNVSLSTFKRIRLGLITLILATDMATHNNILESFKLKLDSFDFSKEDHITAIKMVLIKCCDISNEVRPFEVSEPWVDCLLEEYFNQSDIEKKKGLPVAPFMDREKVTKPAAQIGFIKFVLLPMFETVAELFPEINGHLVKQLKDALEKYQLMKALNDEHKEDHSGKTIKPNARGSHVFLLYKTVEYVGYLVTNNIHLFLFRLRCDDDNDDNDDDDDDDNDDDNDDADEDDDNNDDDDDDDDDDDGSGGGDDDDDQLWSDFTSKCNGQNLQ
ncbi:hypothetical protein LSH36_361g08013 [Paralvinella palmiformis]|uniref:PDEase domain-containing protein n=1 Tax=Paralvinella palmiformis TaxID=53620 RepID=A0AAD9MZG6_9ANNE|nr:hypothetical protein LSH36_361g08013 [Paralvinella palmiformis]